MFCFKCGKQIIDEAAFCPYCGTAQGNAAKAVAETPRKPVASAENHGELDRRALKIHLKDVVSLECMKRQYEQKLHKVACERADILNGNYYQRYHLRTQYYTHLFYNGSQYFIAWSNKKDAGMWMNSYFIADQCHWSLIRNEKDIADIKDVSNFFHATDFCAGFFEARKQKKEASDAFGLAIEAFQKDAPVVYQKNVQRVNELNQSEKSLQQELNKIKYLLQKEYSVNIIPASFRNNLYAVYYLYDFINTSRESFTTALLHCDLDAIKQKLDKIIQQQELIIVQQAIQEAQNQQMIRQNQEQLNYLASIESNTSQTAQYAQIAANNAEVCAWIATAKYLRS